MSRYSGIIKNDVVNGEGVCVSLFMQGCPHHCPGCFNPETWDPKGGEEITEDVVNEILEAISANGIQRNFSILGGEPLASYNLDTTYWIAYKVKRKYPNIKIFLWTGYTIDEVKQISKNNRHAGFRLMTLLDAIVTGRFIEEQKDLTLKWRGSSNQEIWYRKELMEYLTK